MCSRAQSYAYADGILSTAYEEIAEAKANFINAVDENKITRLIYQSGMQSFNADKNKIGRVPYEEIQELILKYVSSNKSMRYVIAESEVVQL